MTDFLREWIEAFGRLVAVASLSRLVFHGYRVRAGERRFFGTVLILELGVALLMAVVGAGLAEWLNLGPAAAQGLVAVLAWLGPKGLEIAAIQYINRKDDK